MVLRAQHGVSRVQTRGATRGSEERRVTAGIMRAFVMPRNPRAYLHAEGGIGAHRFSQDTGWNGSLYGGGGMQIPLRASRFAVRAEAQLYLLQAVTSVRLSGGLKYTF